jgi:hypothetical protein
MAIRLFACLFVFLAGGGLVLGQEAKSPPQGPEWMSGLPEPASPTGSCCEAPAACDCICGPPGRFWARGEYLLWWTKSSPVPPLVTTSPPGTPATEAGVLGLPTTTVLFGGSDVSENPRSGGRLTLGYWVDEAQTLGIEGRFFGLEDRSTTFRAASNGVPILARPFFNAETNRPDSLLVAYPGLLRGQVTASVASQDLWGAEVDLRQNLCCGCCYRVDLIGGYRFLHLGEALAVNETEISTVPIANLAPGLRFDLNDRFETDNSFHGGELGVDTELRRGCFFVDLLARVALGDLIEHVDIIGNTQRAGAGAAPGGFLALPTNMGHFRDSRFAVVPEAGVTFGYRFTEHLGATVGYTFLYWSRVARPGNQVDLAVNPSQLPPGTLAGAPRPAFSLHESDYWAQGLNLGLEFRY